MDSNNNSNSHNNNDNNKKKNSNNNIKRPSQGDLKRVSNHEITWTSLKGFWGIPLLGDGKLSHAGASKGAVRRVHCLDTLRSEGPQSA